jgi:hypothetical protein
MRGEKDAYLHPRTAAIFACKESGNPAALRLEDGLPSARVKTPRGIVGASLVATGSSGGRKAKSSGDSGSVIVEEGELVYPNIQYSIYRNRHVIRQYQVARPSRLSLNLGHITPALLLYRL